MYSHWASTKHLRRFQLIQLSTFCTLTVAVNLNPVIATKSCTRASFHLLSRPVRLHASVSQLGRLTITVLRSSHFGVCLKYLKSGGGWFLRTGISIPSLLMK